MSRFSVLAALLAAPAFVAAYNPIELVNLTSPLGTIKASFIPYGGHATAMWVRDKHSKFRDILLGYDSLEDYVTLPYGDTYFAPIVGRYANRIKNGTFSIPPTQNTPANGSNVFHIPENEHNGEDTLHGGFIGYDQRNWTIVEQTKNSLTLHLVDPDGFQGFPGEVQTLLTYTLEDPAIWKIRLSANTTKETPILLSGHHYWNLEAYEESQDLDAHFAQFEASRFIVGDGIEVPTGEINTTIGTPLDFSKAKSIGENINATAPFQYCGTGCVGFDNAWIYDHDSEVLPKFSMWSKNSGIRMDVITDQVALQLYSCNGIFNATNPIPRKASQGGPSNHYADYSCVVIEQEGWIDAINNPQWNQSQILAPGEEYKWSSDYIFSVDHF